jgi:mono/diheme cytochrome c family protein
MKIFILIYFSLATIMFNYFQQEKSLDQSVSDGNEVYSDFCIQCHLDSGNGIKGVFPPLNNSDYLLENIDKSIYAIKFGLKGKIVVNGIEYNGNMLNQGLEDDEIADVMNYITNNWDNSLKEKINISRVKKIIR